jgi:hypothetical protein
MMKLAMKTCVEMEDILHSHPDVFVLPSDIAKRFSQATQALRMCSGALLGGLLDVGWPQGFRDFH